MIVADASALIDLLLRTDSGTRVEETLDACSVVIAPAIVDSEVAGRLRLATLRGEMGDERAAAALQRLVDLVPFPLPVRPFLGRAWAVRPNLTIADGLYLAAAEAFDCPLLTTDARLRRGAAAVSSAEIILC